MKRITRMSQIRKMMATPPLLLFERQSNLWFRKLLALAGCPAWDDSGHFLLRTLFIIFHYFILPIASHLFQLNLFLHFISIDHPTFTTLANTPRCSRSVSFDIAILFILFLPLCYRCFLMIYDLSRIFTTSGMLFLRSDNFAQLFAQLFSYGIHDLNLTYF